ncbi:MAG TPA: SRPBCC family protein [Candidatus Thermoplasmatota archaeon]|nr:SRPBCC family protein [Candidatus Thermoplasmatota archaeon]
MPAKTHRMEVKGITSPATATVTADRHVVAERWFKATPDRVYAAWTTRDMLERFFWPVGEGKIKEFSLKPGGRLVMGHANEPWTATWSYKEIVPNKRIVFDDHWDDGSGHVATGTMEFLPENGGTRLKVALGPFPKTGPYQPGMAVAGFTMGMDKMAEGLETPGPGEGFRLIRNFFAPPEKVWEMWTTKAGLDQWWKLAAHDMGFRFRVDRLDVKVGGSYDIVMSNQEHGDLHNHGEYLEVVPNERLVYRWDFDIFLGPGETAYPIIVSVEIERTEPWGPGSVGTKMTFTQGPMAKPEHTEGSRQGVISNFAKLQDALAAAGK